MLGIAEGACNEKSTLSGMTVTKPEQELLFNWIGENGALKLPSETVTLKDRLVAKLFVA
jgi:hypothetical protein